MRVMAIDPGVTTGWAIGNYDAATKTLAVEASGYTPWREFAVMIFEAMQDPERRFDHVVYETWRLYKTHAMTQVGSDMPSSQCVGCIWLAVEMANRGGHRCTISDQPAAYKKVIDARMGGPETYLPKSEVDHDRDALRHLWYWAMRKNGDL